MRATSGERFAVDSEVAHRVHGMMRGGAVFHSSSTQLEYMPCQRTEKVDIRFEGHKCDLVQIVSACVRIRNGVRGRRDRRPCVGVGAMLLQSPRPRPPFLALLWQVFNSGEVRSCSSRNYGVSGEVQP